MHRRQLKVAIVMALALLLVAALSAFAAPDAKPTRVSIRLRNVTIPWFFPPPDGLNSNPCPGIPDGIHINPDDLGSNRRKQALVRELPNGDSLIRTWDVVTGTATDNLGGTYTFIYRNNVTAYLNKDEGIGSVKVIDTFRIKGTNASHSLSFKWLWDYYDEDNTLNLFQVHDSEGNLVDFWADFPVWPTDDGVTETTNPLLVPGSWNNVYSTGDPWLCDPI